MLSLIRVQSPLSHPVAGSEGGAISVSSTRSGFFKSLLICVLLACATFGVYSSVARFEFVNFDDEDYVYANPHVAQGLNAHTLAWAFTTNEVGNYHPLSWISWLVDVSLFGMHPGAFHVENVVLHVLNVMLLFVLLSKATGDKWASAFAAAVFALHPSHVESVAWISERKDVLSTLFLLLAMICYVRFASGGGRKFYGCMLVSFALSLLSKQMGVTLPVILLLLDFWPLRRGKLGWRKLTVEKIPLLLLSIAASVVVFEVQRSAGEVATTTALPIGMRLQIVPIAYVKYLSETIWPVNLCAFYPFRNDYPPAQIAACIILLLGITAVCFKLRHRRRYLIVGWLWFGMMLLPVIGLVQVGGASIADRYLYMPSVGLSIMLAWTVRGWIGQSDFRRMAVTGSGLLVISLLGVTAHRQAAYWQNTRTLFTHALSSINDGEFAHLQLGRFYVTENDIANARREYETAARLAPTDFTPEFDLGNLSMSQPAEAIAHYQRALRLGPHNARVENNLGLAFIAVKRPDLAVDALHAAITDDPGFAEPHLNLGMLLESAGSSSAAAAEYQAALKIDPGNSKARSWIERVKPGTPGRR